MEWFSEKYFVQKTRYFLAVLEGSEELLKFIWNQFLKCYTFIACSCENIVYCKKLTIHWQYMQISYFEMFNYLQLPKLCKISYFCALNNIFVKVYLRENECNFAKELKKRAFSWFHGQFWHNNKQRTNLDNSLIVIYILSIKYL